MENVTEKELGMIDKLNKLIAHEKSARKIGNVAEAEAFAAKIQELLFKHKLDMTDLEYSEDEANEPVDAEFVSEYDLTGTRRNTDKSQGWVGVLINAVAKANFCRAIGSRKGNGTTLVGQPTDRATAKALFKYLYDTCIEAAPAHTLAHCGYWADPQEKRRFNKGFKFGFACAIAERLAVEKSKLKAGAQQQGLIRIDQLEKKVDAKVREEFPSLRSSTSSTRSLAGYTAGKVYGGAVGINSTKRLGAGAGR
jgi:hypothetical protein